jgi:hypothetical protein
MWAAGQLFNLHKYNAVPPKSVTAAGQRTTMVLRFINEQGRELDRVVFSRTAGDTLL